MTAPVVTAPAPPAIPPVPPVDALTTRLIAQHGTVENALRHLVTSSIQTDAELSTLRAQNADYKAKLPDGAIVLPKDEAANWKTVVDLKLTPAEIAAAISERDTLKGTVAASALAVHAREGATAAGLDPDGWAAHVARAGLVQEMRDVTVTENRKPVTRKLPFVRPGNDDKAVFVPASEYVAKLQPFEQRALAISAAPVSIITPAHQQQPTPTGSQAAGDPAADYLNKRFAPRQPAGATA